MKEHPKRHSKSILENIKSGDAFAKLTGAKLVELQRGFASANLKVTKRVVNVHNIAHGGAIFALADLVCEAAGNSFGAPAFAVQTNIHFLTPGKCGDLLTATANLTSRMESFGAIDFEVNNQDGRLISKGKQIVIFRKEGKNPA
jgi:acyl-CoA thioesterase